MHRSPKYGYRWFLALPQSCDFRRRRGVYAMVIQIWHGVTNDPIPAKSKLQDWSDGICPLMREMRRLVNTVWDVVLHGYLVSQTKHPSQCINSLLALTKLLMLSTIPYIITPLGVLAVHQILKMPFYPLVSLLGIILILIPYTKRHYTRKVTLKPSYDFSVCINLSPTHWYWQRYLSRDQGYISYQA
jgi:hypothetical protein